MRSGLQQLTRSNRGAFLAAGSGHFLFGGFGHLIGDDRGFNRYSGVLSAGQRENSLTTKESYLKDGEHASAGKNRRSGFAWVSASRIVCLPVMS